MKRFFDLLVSLFGLLLLTPVFLILAILIKLDSPGPVFYIQERVGQGFKLFNLFKFRTMRVDADKLTAITVGARDPRITSVGYYLRKYKLDEFPQLINVLLGTMSLVGPRPELKKFVDLYTPEQQQVLTIKPGITDYASIEFRNENELLAGKPNPIDFYIRDIMPVKLALNIKYLQSQSFWSDLVIIFRTLVSIVK